MKKIKVTKRRLGGIIMKGTRIMKPKKGKGSYDRRTANRVDRDSSPSYAGYYWGIFF